MGALIWFREKLHLNEVSSLILPVGKLTSIDTEEEMRGGGETDRDRQRDRVIETEKQRYRQTEKDICPARRQSRRETQKGENRTDRRECKVHR